MFFQQRKSTVITAATALLVFLLGIGTAQAGFDFCWKDSYGRQAGSIPSVCPKIDGVQTHAEGALCYKDCPNGYERTTWGTCLQTCAGTKYQDQGLFCRKAEYHVDEYPWQFSDPLNSSGMLKRCEDDHGEGECYVPNGTAVAVNKCKDGYSHVLGFCRPDSVPNCADEGFAGQFDLSCTKRLHHKTAYTKVCSSKQEMDAGLCYAPCAAGMDGVGPVCYAQCGQGPLKTECGAGCATSPTHCALQTTDLVVSVLDSAFTIASTVATMGAATAIKSTAQLTTKAAIKQAQDAGFDALKTGVKHVSKDIFKESVKQQLKGVIVKSGIEYVGDAASLTTNTISFVGNITDIANGNYESEEHRNFMIAQEVLNNASLLDPTGILGVAAAYTKPRCSVLASGSGDAGTKPGGVAATLSNFGIYERIMFGRMLLASMRVDDLLAEVSRLDALYDAPIVQLKKPLETKRKKLQERSSEYRNMRRNSPNRDSSHLDRLIRETQDEISSINQEIDIIDRGGRLTNADKTQRAKHLKDKEQVELALDQAYKNKNIAIDVYYKQLRTEFQKLQKIAAQAEGSYVDYYLSNKFLGTNKVLTLLSDGRIGMSDKNPKNNYQLWNFVEKIGDQSTFYLYNKGSGEIKRVDSSQTGIYMADAGNYSGQHWHMSADKIDEIEWFRLSNNFQGPNKVLDTYNERGNFALLESKAKRTSGTFWTRTLTNPPWYLWAWKAGDNWKDGKNFADAKNYCHATGGQLASGDELAKASARGFSMCKGGWLKGGRAGYPMAFKDGNCGNQIGFIDWGTKWDRSRELSAYCVGPQHPKRDGPMLNGNWIQALN